MKAMELTPFDNSSKQLLTKVKAGKRLFPTLIHPNDNHNSLEITIPATLTSKGIKKTGFYWRQEFTSGESLRALPSLFHLREAIVVCMQRVGITLSSGEATWGEGECI